jgi:hypothetical protein
VKTRFAIPGQLAVEHELPSGQRENGVPNPRQILRAARARVHANVAAVPEGDQPDAIVLLLESPPIADETLFSERRRHWLDPIWKQWIGGLVGWWVGKSYALTH